MKNFLIGAVLLIGTMAFANNSTKQLGVSDSVSSILYSPSSVNGGWCEIKVYKNGVLVGYSYTYEESDLHCKMKALQMAYDSQTN